MCLKNKVYLSGGYHKYLLDRRSEAARLCIYTPATDTWDTLETPVYDFALTTYRSKLVLVVGREYVGENFEGNPSNKVWTLSEDGEWEETLPPMETACSDVSAVSHGDHLVVIDGEHKEVRIYNGHYWAKTNLPKQLKPVKSFIFEQLKSTKSAVFNGELYVFAGQWPSDTVVYSASLDSLIASCQPCETSQPSTTWKRLPNIPGHYCHPLVFGDGLIAAGHDITRHNAIYSYSPSDRSWEYVAVIPLSLPLIYTVVLPSNELIVIGEGIIFKAKLDGK